MAPEGAGRRAQAPIAWLVVAGLLALTAQDVRSKRRPGSRAQIAETVLHAVSAAPFPEQGGPDVAVHLPAGFDPADHPGVVVYFHGWNGCVAAAVGDEDLPCTTDGSPQRASRLAAQLDEAGVNALLVAIELRRDASTGEVGDLARPGALRALLAEVLARDVQPRLGVELPVDELDRVVIVSHSGGYQAAASALRYGDVPAVREVVLLDSLYGADDVFDAALLDRSMRVVNLYTYSGGTRDRSLRLAARARAVGRDVSAAADDDDAEVFDQDSLFREMIGHEVVVRRVDAAHAELPRAYMRSVVRAAGLALAP